MRSIDIIILFIVLLIVTLIIVININSTTNLSKSTYITNTTNTTQTDQDIEHFDISTIINDIVKKQNEATETIKKINLNTLSKITNDITNEMSSDIQNNTSKITNVMKTNLLQNFQSTNSPVTSEIKTKSALASEFKTAVETNLENTNSKFNDDCTVNNVDNIVDNIDNIDDKNFYLTKLIDRKLPEKNNYCEINLENEILTDDNTTMLKNSEHINNISFPICENESNINDNYDIDITETYRKKQMYVRSYLEDPIVRGYNIDFYDSSSPLANTGLIKLEKEVNYPKPIGYIFKSSPVFKR